MQGAWMLRNHLQIDASDFRLGVLSFLGQGVKGRAAEPCSRRGKMHHALWNGSACWQQGEGWDDAAALQVGVG